MSGEIRIQASFPDLTGRSAIVTGGSRRIGAGIADFLCRQGMRVVTCGRTAEDGEAVARGIRDVGGDCLWVSADLSLEEDAKRVFEAAAERHGQVDLLVNNAARLRSRPFLLLDEEEYHESFERNVRVVYKISFLAAHHMAERKTGCIVNISSVGGLRAHRGLAGYDASKGAIDALTRCMAVDLSPHGIRVNAVAPGNTRTANPPDELPGVPLGRSGTTEDIAAAVAFLASDASGYVTGQIIYVDGGLTAQLTPPGIFI